MNWYLLLFFSVFCISTQSTDELIYESNEAISFGKLNERLSRLDSLPTYIQNEGATEPPIDITGHNNVVEYLDQIFDGNYQYTAAGYDFPVGKPNGRGYYVAQKFMQSGHLGDDFNSVKGGNSDLGHPIYAIASGVIVFSKDIGGGWGKTIRIMHKNLDDTYTESLYSHCDQIDVKYGQFVKKGDKIGTIGTANGQYFAHLHLEIRTEINLPLGRGYSKSPDGFVSPTLYIRNHRPRW